MSKLVKSSNYLLAVLFVASILLIKAPAVHAVCEVKADLINIKPNVEKSNITLTSDKPCFSITDLEYSVFAYASVDNKGKPLDVSGAADKGWIAPPENNTTRFKNHGETLIENIHLNFKNGTNNGSTGNDRDWIIVVCDNSVDNYGTGNSHGVKSCTEKEDKLIAQAKIYVGENPPNKPPDDLPILNLSEQKSGCSFGKGEPIIIDRIDNIVKNKDGSDAKYGWWRYGVKNDDITDFKIDTNQDKNEFWIINQNPPYAQAKIRNTGNFDPQIQRICIDLTKYGTERAAKVQYKNCLFIDMVAGKVDQPMSCDDAKEGFLNCSKYPGRCTSSGSNTCDNGTGIPTAIGCIHTNPVALVKDFLKFALGISGGLAFLLMILGAFQMLTSAGNPETLAAGKSRLTSAIIGLLFVIFSVLLLKIIGVDILGLGGQFGY